MIKANRGFKKTKLASFNTFQRQGTYQTWLKFDKRPNDGRELEN